MSAPDDDKMRQAYGARRPGFDFFKDGFATVRQGDLPSGSHIDPRMNTSLLDVKSIMRDWPA